MIFCKGAVRYVVFGIYVGFMNVQYRFHSRDIVVSACFVKQSVTLQGINDMYK